MTFLLLYLLYAISINILLNRRGLGAAPSSESESATPPTRPQRILIIGATGGTGRELVKQALDRGYTVTAFVRNPAKLQIKHPQLRIATGDVLDHESVGHAMAGQEMVISALGHRQYFHPTWILSKGTANVLEAMESEGLRRFVCETSLGIGNSVGRMGLYYSLFVIPFILPFYFFDKCRQEKLIAASRAEWVIVRPGGLTNGPKRAYRHGDGTGNFIWTVRISRANVAEFMLDQLTDNRYLRQTVGICRQ